MKKGSSLRAKQSNPTARKGWIASSLALVAMTAIPTAAI
jgi:hypothetical protein